MDKGLRYNEGKTRHDLLPSFAQEQYAKVMTAGAKKYESRNWEKGMAWSKVLASLKRHLLAIENGEDYDVETGVLHSAHVMTNAAFLTEYYKIYPQGDDRPHSYLKIPKIGLDIDGVICDWFSGWRQKFGEPSRLRDGITSYKFSYSLGEQYKNMSEEETTEFYMNLKPLIDPLSIPFEPHCYITMRNVPSELTMQWLQLHGFPTAEVITVGHGVSKVEAAKQSGVEIYVDDRFETFVELNNAGICCYLMDAPHNQRYNVGHKRIYSLKDLV